MPGCDILLVFALPPRDSIHCSTKDVYTSEITFLALDPWDIQGFSYLGDRNNEAEIYMCN